jgi:hypothetical protein
MAGLWQGKAKSAEGLLLAWRCALSTEAQRQSGSRWGDNDMCTPRVAGLIRLSEPPSVVIAGPLHGANTLQRNSMPQPTLHMALSSLDFRENTGRSLIFACLVYRKQKGTDKDSKIARGTAGRALRRLSPLAQTSLEASPRFWGGLAQTRTPRARG